MAHITLRISLAAIAFVLPAVLALGSTSYNGLAKTPQMGWGTFLLAP